MSDSATAQIPVTTPLASVLAAAAKPLALVEYRGVMTPHMLDAASDETEALAHGAAVHDKGWLRRVEVRGEDRFRWLSGMVTNTVKDLPENGGAWNLVLNAQGRILGDLTVWRTGEALTLEMEAAQAESLLAHFEHFIIMDDVELVALDTDASTAETAIGLTGPKASQVLARMGLPALAEPMTATHVEWNGLDLRVERGYGAAAEHYTLWVLPTGLQKLWRMLRTGGAGPAGSAAVEAFRVAEGIPLYGVDMVERDLPQETAQMRALHFNKGCYLGQEIVERIRSRGNVHRHLRQLELEGPIPASGTELMQNDAPVGHVTSAAELAMESGTRTFALGMIRAEGEVRNEPLTYTSGGAAGVARILKAQPQL